MFVLKYNYFGIMNYELGIVKNKSLKFFSEAFVLHCSPLEGIILWMIILKKIQIKI
jgi:hypothetical protein